MKKKFLIGTVLMSVLFAADPVDNIFQAGDVVKASEINSNFQKVVDYISTLESKVATLESSADINISDVRSFNSGCLTSQGQNVTLPYTVPTGKAFVVTSIIVTPCTNYTSTIALGRIKIASKYESEAHIHYSRDLNFIQKFNPKTGIIVNEGEEITFQAGYIYNTSGLILNVNGYETNL